MDTIVKIFNKALDEIRFRRKLKKMDNMWYFMGGSCFGMFPPSFYYTHTKEELERITAEKVDELQKMIDNRKKPKACTHTSSCNTFR